MSDFFDWGGGGRSSRPRTGNGSLDDAIETALGSVGGGDSGRSGSKPKGSSNDPRRPIGDSSTFVNGYPVPGTITGGLSPASAYGTPGSYYVNSDIYLPLTLSPDQIWQLQKALRRAGWISGDVEHPGQWTTESQDAFRDLLEYANQNGIDWRDALGQSLEAQQAGNGFGGGGGGGSGGARYQPSPLTISLPNEDEVRKAVQRAGRDITDVDVGPLEQQITTAYMDYLRDYQLREYEASERQRRAQFEGEDPEQRTKETPETLESFAEDQIREERPGLVRNAQVGNAEETFMDVMTRSYG